MKNLDKVIFKLTKMYLLVIFYKLPYSVFLYLISVLSVFSTLSTGWLHYGILADESRGTQYPIMILW